MNEVEKLREQCKADLEALKNMIEMLDGITDYAGECIAIDYDDAVTWGQVLRRASDALRSDYFSKSLFARLCDAGVIDTRCYDGEEMKSLE